MFYAFRAVGANGLMQVIPFMPVQRQGHAQKNNNAFALADFKNKGKTLDFCSQRGRITFTLVKVDW